MLKKEEVRPGAIVRIEINGVFDGYVKLIEPAGKEFAEMETDTSPVVVKRRWLVEYVDEGGLTGSERFTQAVLKGKRTHRNIKFVAGAFSQVYKRYTYIEPKPSNGDYLTDDDINDIF